MYLYCNVLLSNRKMSCKGDLNETLFIGEVDEASKKLTRVTHEALMKAIEIGMSMLCFATYAARSNCENCL